MSATKEHENECQEPASEKPVDQTQDAEESYSVFTVWQKRGLIFTASVASFFSPMTGAIYMPALATIAEAEHVSLSAINFTVTSYLIFQGLAPTFVGGFSDSAGRRPAYYICFIIYIGANLGLALQNNYAALLILRCVQSSGSSGTVAIANAIAADIVTSAERGSYIAYASVTSILAPSVSPVIGGLLAQYAGWRWIFWFCLIFSVVFFIPFLALFPETCRKIVGNGSIPPPAICHSVPTYLYERRLKKEGRHSEFEKRDELAKGRKIRFPNPVATLVIVFNKQAGFILISNGLLFATWYAVSTAIPSQFRVRYHLNDGEIGLMYLPLGAGSIISAFTTGKLIDWNYRRWAKRLGRPVLRNKQDDLTGFPIETARLQIALPLMYVGGAAVVAFGWLVENSVHLAWPCVAMFFFGYSIIAGFNVMNILMVDTYPGKPATATAANNLVRCLLGAGASAVVLPLVNKIGFGWTCTLAAFVWLGFSPLLWILMARGPRWREEIKRKEEAKEQKKAAAKTRAMAQEVQLVPPPESIELGKHVSMSQPHDRPRGGSESITDGLEAQEESKELKT